MAYQPNDFEINIPVLEHKIWTSCTFLKYIKRLWNRQVTSASTKPESLIPLIIACKGYSFNHLTTRLDSDTIQYCWERIDTIQTVLLSRRSSFSTVLKNFVIGRDSIGYQTGMGLVHYNDQPPALTSPSDDIELESTFKSLLNADITVERVPFPRVMYDSIEHLVMDRQVASNIKKHL